MKRFWWLGALLLSLVITKQAKGGGIVQEMNIAPPDIARHSASAQTQTPPTASVPKPDDLPSDAYRSRQKENTSCGTMFRIEQLQYERSARLSWSGPNEEGKTPVKYLIYRRTQDGSWELIGEVDGGTFSYTDRDLPSASTYSYRVVAVYETEGGAFQRLQYPPQSIALHEPLSPPIGMGCQATPWQQLPSLWLLIFLLPLLLYRRQATA